MFRRALGLALTWAACLYTPPIHAQACCAGAGAVTPGRLVVHEDALVGLQARVANVFGSFDSHQTYRAAPADTTEWDFEQNLFGALRVVRRGQLALLVPAVQTYRNTGRSEFGGGLGDVNFSGRYDFVLAGESLYIPGAAVLAGITFPTGTSVEAAEQPLATDATGVGAFQGNLGLALEQTFGPWLFGLTGLVAKRTSRGAGRTRTTPGTQFNVMFATAYTFPNDAALALLLSYTLEGAPVVSGEERSDLSRRIPRFGFAGIYPLTDQWRLQGGLFLTPPVSGFGRNTPSNADLLFTVIRSWS
jgi:hypothetical protein